MESNYSVEALFKKERKNYRELIKNFNFYDDSYIGGTNYTSKKAYLDRHKNEREKDYLSRLNRTHYSNYNSKYVNNIIKNIFSFDITRSGMESLLNVLRFFTLTGQKTSQEDFWRELFKHILIKGEMYVYADSFTQQQDFDDIYSKYDEINGRILWTCTPIKPQEIQYIKVEQGLTKEVIINRKWTITYEKETYIADSVYMDDEKIVFKTRSENGTVSYKDFENKLGKVPVLKFSIDENGDGVGESIIRDSAAINRTIYNLESLALEMCRDNVKPKIGLPLSEENANIIEKYYPFDEHTQEYLFDDPPVMPFSDKGNNIMLLQVDTKNYDNIQNYIELLKLEMKDILDQRMNEMHSQSGVSKSYDIMETNQMLSFLSSMFANLEHFFYIWIGDLIGINVDGEQIRLTYPDHQHFDKIIETNDYVDNLKLMYPLIKNVSPTAGRKIIEALINVNLGNVLSDQEKEVILQEIKNTQKLPDFQGNFSDNLSIGGYDGL